MKYLQSYHLIEFENFCRDKCTYIVINNHSNKDKDILEYQRGRYIGFIYGIRVSKIIIKKNKSVTNIELYKNFKTQQKKVIKFNYNKTRSFQSGVYDVLYELMRYCSDKLI